MGSEMLVTTMDLVSDGANNAAVIGGAVGGAIAALLLLAGIVWLVRRNSAKQKDVSASNNDDEEMASARADELTTGSHRVHEYGSIQTSLAPESNYDAVTSPLQ
jgi:predicted phage tail protein